MAAARIAGTRRPPVIEGLNDRRTARRLAREGYARLGPLLTLDEVARARRVFEEAVADLDRPVGEEWFPTILLPEAGVRAAMDTGLRAIVEPHLGEVFDEDVVELMRLDYSVKPPSEASGLGPHQDFSVIDEAQSMSLYVWIPLSDTDTLNGTLHVVPGSHLFGNRIRSQHVPAVFDEVLELVHRSAIQLDCRAGELIVMVSGVIHYSPPNLSKNLRLAAHGIIKPVSAPLVFYFADDDTPDGKVECYEVDIEQYVDLVRHGRPSADLPPTHMVDRPPERMTPKRYRRGLRASQWFQ